MNQDLRNDDLTPDAAFGDAWLERLLQEAAAEESHIEDGGFSSRVLGALPQPVKTKEWLVPVMTVLGCVLAAFLTPAGSVFEHSLLALADWRHISVPQLLSLVVPVALAWSLCFNAARES